jgi:hypothetical protein
VSLYLILPDLMSPLIFGTGVFVSVEFMEPPPVNDFFPAEWTFLAVLAGNATTRRAPDGLWIIHHVSGDLVSDVTHDEFSGRRLRSVS